MKKVYNLSDNLAGQTVAGTGIDMGPYFVQTYFHVFCLLLKTYFFIGILKIDLAVEKWQVSLEHSRQACQLRSHYPQMLQFEMQKPNGKTKGCILSTDFSPCIFFQNCLKLHLMLKIIPLCKEVILYKVSENT